MKEIIEGLRKHALANYDHPEIGWDYIVEAYEDEELEKDLVTAKVKTLAGAIKFFEKELRPLRSRDNEMRAMRDW